MPLLGPQLPNAPKMQAGSGGRTSGSLPVSPPLRGIAAPPANDAELQARVSGWDQFMQNLTAPGASSLLFNLGTALLSDKQPGESSVGHGINALRFAVGTQTALKEQQRKRAQEEKKMQLEERKVAATETGVENQAQYNKDRLDVERQRIEQTGKYYEALAKNAAAKNALTADQAYQYASTSLNEQVKSIDKQLELMNTDDPNYQSLMNLKKDILDNFGTRVQSMANQWLQTPQASGGGSGATAWPANPDEAFSQILAANPGSSDPGSPTYQRALQAVRAKYGKPDWNPAATPAPAPTQAPPGAPAPSPAKTEPQAPAPAQQTGPYFDTPEQARSNFEHNTQVWARWQNTLNPEQTKAQAIEYLTNPSYLQMLTPEQRKQAESILSTLR